MLNKIINIKAHKEQELYFKVQSIAKETIEYAKKSSSLISA